MCILFIALLADVNSDMITGGAGWVGAGLLGLVLGWLLLVRIPAMDRIQEAKDKQVTTLTERFASSLESKDAQITIIIDGRTQLVQDLIDGRDSMVKELTDKFSGTMKDMAAAHDNAFAIAEKDRRTDFHASLTAVISNCQREWDMLKELVDKEVQETAEAIVDLRRAIEELREVYIRASNGRENRGESPFKGPTA